jgi:hypothetical protein
VPKQKPYPIYGPKTKTVPNLRAQNKNRTQFRIPKQKPYPIYGSKLKTVANFGCMAINNQRRQFVSSTQHMLSNLRCQMCGVTSNPLSSLNPNSKTKNLCQFVNPNQKQSSSNVFHVINCVNHITNTHDVNFGARYKATLSSCQIIHRHYFG